MEKIVEKAPELLARVGERPLEGLTDTHLPNLRQQVEEAAWAGREATALEGPRPADDRTNRLADAELECRIFTTRFTAGELASINDPAARRGHQQLPPSRTNTGHATGSSKKPNAPLKPQNAATAPLRYGRLSGTAGNRRARGQEVIAAAPALKNASAHSPRPVAATEAPVPAGIDSPVTGTNRHIPAGDLTGRYADNEELVAGWF